ncbi:MAG: LysM peptidoglycan-binding domain-containing protein [Solirubrobacterales bacterium]
MATPRQSSPARLAAIVALIAAFVVLLVVVVSSLAGGDGSEGPASRQDGGRQQESKGSNRSQQSQRRIYVVKPGDCCLSQIAQKTGIDVDTLVQLNPNLDPQAIHSGDRVKLR